MCGKFTQLVQWKDDTAFFDHTVVMPEDAPVTFATPMRMAKVIRLGEDGRPELTPMKWGFSKPENPSFKSDHMHARSETVDSKPTFTESFEERRGILMVHSFNEGEELPGGKTKQWVFSPKDRKPLAIAVIWQDWQDDAGVVACFIQLTVPANPLVSRIADRMPAILPREDWDKWLGLVDTSLKDVRALLRTLDDGGNWEMSEQASPKSAKAAKAQMDLF